MRIFDCTTFYNENFILDVRFNILDPYVDKFIVCESGYSHSGEKKNFNFDINKFEKFKNKIIYLKIDKEPEGLKYFIKNGEKIETKEDARVNAIKRIAFQRNYIQEGIIDASKDDLIIYSDNDEIPNLKNFKFENIKDELIYFKQKLYYYKFNLFCDRYDWYGSKGCKKKKLLDFEWLRNTKPKKYKPFRLDTFFSNTKYINVKIINDGGWHFNSLLTPKEISSKLRSFAHQEFSSPEYSNEEIIKENISNHRDLFKRNLNYEKVELDKTFPKFILENKDLFKEWIV